MSKVTTYAELNASRRKWIQRDPLRVESFNENAIAANGPDVLARCIAFALYAELPVKEFVLDSHPKELPISEDAKKCLLGNAGDEDRHYHAFLKADMSYPTTDEYKGISSDLVKHFQSEGSHPIEIAGFLETGIFQITLTLMRILGTPAIVSLAAKVSEDETRHQATNRGVMRSLGYDPRRPSRKLQALKRDTLDWLLAPLVDCEALGLTKDELYYSSDNLVATGSDEYLTMLTTGAEYVLPFENANSALY